jgi:large subunit ribosomal protein L21
MTMYAVIRAGGKQYRVAPDDVLDIDRVSGEPGDTLEFGDVLLLGGGDGEPQIGAPLVSGATVAAELVEHRRGEKIIVFKKRRRQNSRRKNGHRQDLTTIRITQILSDGEKPKKQAKTKPAAEKSAASEAKAAETEGAKPKAEKAPKAKAKAAKTEE